MYKHISRGALEEWLVQCSAAESSVSWRRPGPWQALPRALPTLCLGPSKHLGPQDAALPQAPGHKGSPQMIYGFDFDFDQSRHRPTSLLSLCFQSLFVCFLHHLSDLLQTDTLSVQHLAVDICISAAIRTLIMKQKRAEAAQGQQTATGQFCCLSSSAVARSC